MWNLLSRLPGFGPSLSEVTRKAATAPVRALIFSEHLNATYYISFHFVLETLARQGRVQSHALSQHRVQLLQRRWPDPNDLAEALCRKYRPTVAVFSRYALPSGRTLLEAFKRHGIPTIYHIDDDLLELPSSLGNAIMQSHGAREVIEERRAMLAGADLIYSSTRRLAERLRDRFPGRRIIYGDIYASYMTFLPRVMRRGNPSDNTVTIGYMGSKSHAVDLQLAVPAITEVMHRNPHVRLELFGSIAVPPGWKALGERVRSYQALGDYRQFIAKFSELQWDIGIAPLEDNPFNACKAPTKFVEYTLCGVAVVASNNPVYADVIDGSNGLLATSTESWVSAVDSLIRNADERRALLVQAERSCDKRFAFDAFCTQVERILSTRA